MKVRANGLDIEVEVTGDRDAPVMLLVMGLGAQLTLWPPAFVEGLVAKGFRVVRFDNRDVGLSTKLDAAGTPNLMWVMGLATLGLKAKVPYTLGDMARDAVGVLDALGINRAHVVGASMGGMIAQLLAADHPERVRSLCSIMSTTGNRAVPRSSAEAMQVMMDRPRAGDFAATVEHAVRAATVIGSPGYPVEPAALRERILRQYRRAHHPAGFTRQLAAIGVASDRRRKLRRIAVPTIVIHGTDDPLVPVEGGRDTAASIPGARLYEMPGMGHDLPEALIPRVVDLVAENARAADPQRG